MNGIQLVEYTYKREICFLCKNVTAYALPVVINALHEIVMERYCCCGLKKPNQTIQ